VNVGTRADRDKAGARLVTTETSDKMTEPEIVAYVRYHFCQEAKRQGV